MGIGLTIFSAWSQKTANEITYQFEQGRVVIGRGPGSDVRLPDRTVSDTHAFIRLESDGYVVLDNNSTNGTTVNSAPIVPGRPKLISNGDLIEIGEYVLKVHTNVAIALPTSSERTASLARRLIREIRAPSTADIRPPRLTIRNGKQSGQYCEIPPAPARLVIGRAEGCQLIIDDPDVSREHIEVIRDLDGVIVRNLGSKNGVVVAGQPVEETRLRNGAELQIGSTHLRFEDPADESIQGLSQQSDLPTARSANESSSAPDKNKRKNWSGQTKGDHRTPVLDSIKTPPSIHIKPPLATADIIVYFVAAIVTVSSIIGLFILLNSE